LLGIQSKEKNVAPLAKGGPRISMKMTEKKDGADERKREGTKKNKKTVSLYPDHKKKVRGKELRSGEKVRPQ